MAETAAALDDARPQTRRRPPGFRMMRARRHSRPPSLGQSGGAHEVSRVTAHGGYWLRRRRPGPRGCTWRLAQSDGVATSAQIVRSRLHTLQTSLVSPLSMGLSLTFSFCCVTRTGESCCRRRQGVHCSVYSCSAVLNLPYGQYYLPYVHIVTETRSDS